MIVDWYVCSCLGCSPEKANVLASIVGHLEDPESESDMVTLALQELPKMGISERVYALPAVLASMRRTNRPDGWRDLAMSYIEGHDEPAMRGGGGLAGIVRSACDDASSTATADDLIELLKTAVIGSVTPMALRETAASVSQRSSDVSAKGIRSPTQTPYLDLAVFVPELVWLAVAAHAAKQNPAVAGQLSADISEATRPGSVAAIIEVALDGGFGRLAQRLAVRVHLFAGGDPLLVVSRICRSNPSARYEPDILRTIAEALYMPVRPEAELRPAMTHDDVAGDPVRTLVSEATRLKHWARLCENELSGTDSAPVLRRLGIDNPKEAESFAQVLWRLSLLDVAAAVAPIALAEHLKDPWQRPARSSAAVPRGRLERDAGAPVIHNCPWLSWRIYQDKIQYNDVGSTSATIYLMSAASTASTLLRNSPLSEPASATLAALIVHAADVIETEYGQWLRNYDKPTPAPGSYRKASKNITTVILFAKRRLDEAGKGELDPIPPARFVSLLSAPCSDFTDRIVPRVLLAWIEDAVLGAVPGSSARRWIQHVENVFNHYVERAWDSEQLPKKQNAFLLACSVIKGVRARLESEGLTRKFDDALRAPDKRNLRNRTILAASRLPPLAWESWRESEQWTPEQRQGNRLAVAIQRLISITTTTPGEPIGVGGVTCWSEFRDCIAAISQPGHCDRFARSRLLDLLESDSLQRSCTDDGSGREPFEDEVNVALLLCEFGSAYDLHRLFSTIFHESMPPLRQRVAIRIIPAVFELLASQTDTARDARDPRQIRMTERRSVVIRQAVLGVAQRFGQSRADAQGRIIIQCVKQSHDSLMAPSAADTRCLHAEVAATPDGERMRLAGDDPNYADCFVRSAVRDPNGSAATLFCDDLELRDVDNLFARPAAELRPQDSEADAPSRWVLAHIVNVRRSDDDWNEVSFNCGLSHYLRSRFRRDFHCVKGTWVALPIKPHRRRDGRVGWLVSASESPEHIRTRIRNGAATSVRVHEQNPIAPDSVALSQLWCEPRQHNLETWDPDVSRRFCPVARQRPHDVPAIWIDGQAVPIERDLLGLSLDGFEYAAGTIGVLTFIGLGSMGSGRRSYRFSSAPGRNFSLGEGDFHDTAITRLESELSRLSDPRGLLMLVRLAERDDHIALDLLDGVPDDPLFQDRYPAFDAPCDKRNIDWRRAVETDCLIAQRTPDGNWQYCTTVPGFPYARVNLKPRPKDASAKAAEFSPAAWDYRNGIIDAQPAMTFCLNLPHADARQRFLDTWLHLKLGDSVTLRPGTAFTGIQRDGCAIFPTAENAGVFVEAESLSMRAIRADTRPTIALAARIAEVTLVNDKSEPTTTLDASAPDGALDGIIFAVFPHVITILWQGPDGPILQEAVPVDLEDLQRRIRPGHLVSARPKSASSNMVTIHARMVRVRALWTVVPGAPTAEDAVYLGHVVWDGTLHYLYEGAPGELVVATQKPRRIQHLSTSQCVGIVDHVARVRELWWGRIVLHTDKDVVTGRTRSQRLRLDGRVRIHNVVMELTESRNLAEAASPLFALERLFEVIPDEAIRVESDIDTADEELQERLDSYLRNPHALRAIINAGAGTATIDDMMFPSSGGGWSEVLTIEQDESSFIAEPLTYDSGDALVMVRETASGYCASCRSVPPRNVAGYRGTLLGLGWCEGDSLPRRLYYVGPERDKASGETWHRFEWGFGHTLLSPEKDLRFNGRLFNTARLILFHGDAISRVEFQRAPVGLTSECQDAEYLLNIVGVQFDFQKSESDGHALYRQCVQMRIVHTLHVCLDNDQIRILSVEGLDEERTDANTQRQFHKSRARLDETDQQKLIAQQGTPEQRGQTFAILGRLDRQRFEQAAGRDVVFHHVVMTLAGAGDRNALTPHDVLFMEAGDIEPTLNDVRLLLQPNGSIRSEDIGNDVDRTSLTRRRFSHRQDLLPRILRGPKGITGARGPILVCLRRTGDKTVPDMTVLPPRSLGTLRSKLRGGSVVLASVADPERLRLELHPGVFVELPGTGTDRPRSLRRHDLVRISQSEDRFRLTIAEYGGNSYLAGDGRPAVGLPMNSLLRSASNSNVRLRDFWNRQFSIGDLPDVVPNLAGAPEAVQTLMQQSHPKLVRVWIDESGQAAFTPLRDARFVGAIQRDSQLLSVSQIPIVTADSHANAELRGAKPLEWRYLTFAHESARHVLERCGTDKWRYHDEYTVVWPSSEPARIGNHDVFSGPLFFASGPGKQLRLRYTPDELPRFGLPVEHLLQSLREANGATKMYTVAAPSDCGGLWIEIVPGRVAELPGDRVVCQVGGREQSLASMHWTAFAPGDRISLGLTSTDDLATDRVMFHNWFPSIRGALRGSRAFLPVQHFDGDAGGLTLGAGGFTLTLPEVHASHPGSMLILLPDNTLMPAQQRLPEQGDVVLLAVNDRGELGIAGFPELAVQWDAGREDDPVRDWFSTRARLTALVRAAGGTLPVTVAHVRDGTLRFTRNQDDVLLAPDTCAISRVAGQLDREHVVLRLGGGIVIKRLEELVTGIPPRSATRVTDLLRTEPEAFVWLRGLKPQGIGIGIEEEDSREFREFEARLVQAGDLGSSDRPVPGLLCRSFDTLRLYWLPERHASWAWLSKEELGRTLVKSGVSLRLRQSGTSVRANDVATVAREFDDSACGTHMNVRSLDVTRKDGDLTISLVQSLTSNMVLECVRRSSASLSSDEFTVEITSRSYWPRRTIRAVRPDEKRYQLRLPAWIHNAESRRAQFTQELCAWATSEAVAERDLQARIALAQAYHDGRKSDEETDYQLATTWCANTNGVEVEAIPALMAATILCRSLRTLFNQDAAAYQRDKARRREASEFIRTLSRRAYLSGHVEHLAEHALWTAERQSSHPLQRRISAVLSRLASKTELTAQEWHELDRLCLAVKIAHCEGVSDPQFVQKADALLAAMGKVAPRSTIFPDCLDANATHKLARISRLLPHAEITPSSECLTLCERELRHICDYLIAQKRDLVLLDPLPCQATTALAKKRVER